jgi:hypothetical protein
MILRINSVNKLIVVMETGCVFIEVRTELLNIIYINFLLQRVNMFIYRTHKSVITKGVTRNLYKILAQKPEEKRPLRRLGARRGC